MDRAQDLLTRVGLHRPEIRAWAMYDWANSAFATTIITAIFPVYFTSVAGADLPAGAPVRLEHDDRGRSRVPQRLDEAVRGGQARDPAADDDGRNGRVALF
jgi:MFS-type transporter involved in bile tolerance (Atg22 family)